MRSPRSLRRDATSSLPRPDQERRAELFRHTGDRISARVLAKRAPRRCFHHAKPRPVKWRRRSVIPAAVAPAIRITLGERTIIVDRGTLVDDVPEGCSQVKKTPRRRNCSQPINLAVSAVHKSGLQGTCTSAHPDKYSRIERRDSGATSPARFRQRRDRQRKERTYSYSYSY